MLSRVIDRYLDPGDSLGEILFGLIMALTVTAGARLLTQREELNPSELIEIMLGCNVAWGIIDAVLYLIGSLFARNRRVHFVRRLRAAKSEAEAMAAIRDEFALEDEPDLPPEDRATFHRVILDIMRHAGTGRARLRLQDFQAAAVIVALVSLSAVPGVLPLLLIDAGHIALQWANWIQTCLLFLIGFHWARYSGADPWRTGLGIVALAVSLVMVAVALGG